MQEAKKRHGYFPELGITPIIQLRCSVHYDTLIKLVATKLWPAKKICQDLVNSLAVLDMDESIIPGLLTLQGLEVLHLQISVLYVLYIFRAHEL